MSDIEEVKQRSDIVEVIGGYVPLAKSGRNFRGLCPFHKEKTPSFFVFPDRQSWHCFGACNAGGDVFSFIMKKEGVGFGDALRTLAGRAGITLRERVGEKPEEKEKLARLYQINQAAAQYFHEALGLPAAVAARQYLDKRGVNQKSVADFLIGYAPGGHEALKRSLVELGYGESDLLLAGLLVKGDDGSTYDRFRNRLMFPIFDFQGRVTGFGGRVLDNAMPKYLNSPQTPVFDKSRSLYAVNLAREAARQADSVVLVEGYLDVIIAHQYGFQNVIAPMGTALTQWQIDIIKRLRLGNLILALDPDAAGEKAMLRGLDYKKHLETQGILDDSPEVKDADKLADEGVDYIDTENRFGAEVRVAVLPAGEDPDEVIRRDAGVFKACLEAAVPVMDYVFDVVKAGLNVKTPKGKTEATLRLLPLVAEIENDTRRTHYLYKLADMTGTSYNKLDAEASLSRLKSRPGLRRIPPPQADRDLKKALSSPLEEYCLTLLLKYPDLMAGFSGLDREYFEDTRHREIFDAFRRSKNLAEMREQLDEALHDYLDHLANASVKAGAVEGKFKQCALRLRENYLKRVAARRGQALAQASGEVTPENLAELQQPSQEISERLREVERQLGGRQRPGQGGTRWT
ncbi:MAG: DNA primase [Dehalococcoidia bacterium]|nr:MAG: DNA primase [Dehalococcoidia bacterium]